MERKYPRSALMALSCGLVVGCTSSPQERTLSERASDAALGTVAHAVTGMSFGASGDAAFSTKLEAVIVGGYSCLTISPGAITLSITDIRTGKTVAFALPVLKDWVVVAELKLLKGEHAFSLRQSSTKEVFSGHFTYAGEGVWKPTLKLQCPTAP